VVAGEAVAGSGAGQAGWLPMPPMPYCFRHMLLFSLRDANIIILLEMPDYADFMPIHASLLLPMPMPAIFSFFIIDEAASCHFFFFFSRPIIGYARAAFDADAYAARLRYFLMLRLFRVLAMFDSLPMLIFSD